MTMYPVVPDLQKYPGTGRSVKDTFGEIGLAGHWIKLAAPLPVHLQGQGPPGLALDPRVGEETTMDHTADDIAAAPLPTPKTLRARGSLVIQFERFLAINLKMAKIIRKEHH